MSKKKDAADIKALILDFLDRHYLTRHILYIFLSVLGLVIMITLWLRFYTDHGTKILIPDFEDMYIADADRLASKNSFEIFDADSVFVIGKPGGMVLNQNPKPGSYAKKGRKIYVTLSKSEADKITVAELPVLYGNDYNQKKLELGYRGLRTSIKGRRFDPGEPDHILEVWYKDQLIISGNEFKSNVKISLGDELEFVLSDAGGGEIQVPDLVCLSYEEASFIITSSKLKIGEIQETGSIPNISKSFVVSQFPQYVPGEKMTMGSSVNLVLSQGKPDKCN
jgi:beta-lactam-binding protein with PASTA domain